MTFLLIILILFGLSFILPVDLGNTAFGSAKFTRHGLDYYKTNAGLILDGNKKGLSLNASCGHLFLIAPTSSGKTTKVVLPNLLIRNDWSWVCLDPKGELKKTTGSAFARKGYNVLSLEFESSSSDKFNPLKRVNTESEIKGFCTNLRNMTQSEGSKSDAFWPLMASRLIETLLRCVKNMPLEFQTVGTLLTMINHIDDGIKVEYLINTYAPDEHTKQKYTAFLNQDFKIRSGIQSQAISMLDMFDTTEIKFTCSQDTIDFSSFRKQKTILFLNFNVGSSERVGPIISIFFSQFFEHLLNTEIQQFDLPIGLMLEELPNISTKIPRISEAISLLRSKICPMIIVTQSKAQLSNIYGEKVTQSILSNCNSYLALPGIRESETLKMIRDLIGESTVSSSNPLSSKQKNRRYLMTLDEIRRSKSALLITQTGQPLKVNPIPIYKNKRLMELAGLHSVDGVMQPIDPIPEPSIEPIIYKQPTIDELIKDQNPFNKILSP